MLTASCDHEHDAMPLGRGAGYETASADGLIVGMGVKADQCCHRSSLHAGVPLSGQDAGKTVALPVPFRRPDFPKEPK